MPIKKNPDNSIIELPLRRADQFDQTGTVHSDFAICDTDVLKQVKFDPAPQTTNTTLTLQSPPITVDTTIILPNGGTISNASFKTVQTDLGTSPVATGPNDVLTLTSSDNSVTITGDFTTDTIDFQATGGGGGSPGGSDKDIQFNDAGSFGGITGFTYDIGTNTLASTIPMNGYASLNTYIVAGSYLPGFYGQYALEAWCDVAVAPFQNAFRVKDVSGGGNTDTLTIDKDGNLNTLGVVHATEVSAFGSAQQLQYNSSGHLAGDTATTDGAGNLTATSYTGNSYTGNTLSISGAAIDVIGNLTAVTIEAFGATSNVQYNSGGVLAGDGSFIYDAAGNVTATAFHGDFTGGAFSGDGSAIFNVRKLYNNAGSLTVDGNAKIIYATNGGNISFGTNELLYSGSGNASLNWDTFTMYNYQGFKMVDWSGNYPHTSFSIEMGLSGVSFPNGICDASNNNLVVSSGYSYYDGTNFVALDTQHRQLKVISFTVVDWSGSNPNSAAYWFDSGNSYNLTGSAVGLTPFVGDSGAGGAVGTVPAPATGDTAAGKYLFADGTWATTPNNTQGDLVAAVVGKGLQVKEGTDAKLGVATLVAGTVTVTNTSVTANSRIFITANSTSTSHGSLAVENIVVATSFDINSTDILDDATVAWMIVEAIP